MNKLMTVVLALMISVSSFAGDGFDNLYSKYSGDKEVTSLNLTSSMLKIASKFLDKNDAEAKVLLESIESVKLLISEKSNPKLSNDANAMMKSGGYEDLIKVNDGDDHVRIMVKETGDIIKDIIVLANDNSDFVLINIKGNIDPEQVGKVLNTLDIDVDVDIDGWEGLNAK
ncbi:MAG: DUF4252 domain-containing protein [Bacteroidetes bacterium]|nr:DUF4252 domain-containing protein [Bacteroidota bacterium]